MVEEKNLPYFLKKEGDASLCILSEGRKNHCRAVVLKTKYKIIDKNVEIGSG